ncbi:IPTL-CTERM sorting domain-containing protein [Paracidovorax sp. MALMAid1276]|uniref:IPTL-CTERM sorting domain-containing protein n=1 Tax=Paracidovorax sp. MALMAid1276 TaxID=3411631 RepID=UPI003B9A5EE4
MFVSVPANGHGVRVTITWPQPVADFIRRTHSGQFIVPASVDLGGTTVGFDVTDNQPGDDDATPGVIADPVMPLAAATPHAIPALSPWVLLLLGLMAGALGMAAQRRRA